MTPRVITTPFELQRFLNCNDATLQILCRHLCDLRDEPTPWATYEPIQGSEIDAVKAYLVPTLAVVNEFFAEYDASAIPGDEDNADCQEPKTLILTREAFDSSDPLYNPAPQADALLPITADFTHKCEQYFYTGTYDGAEDPATIPEFEYDGKITLDAIYDADDTLDDELDQ